ncbi:hypothetical protein H2200_002154 [Cladophialophora chaetospira]|uniref:NAD dependent epimerase/dehydratase n=1 Tax=Cladophialophora chaetospira TaxID=386627 RepID=A0AA39CN85_9EURO|nr:hypothetical protein H2200_002154 [Cladophialophora chaetospira]
MSRAIDRLPDPPPAAPTPKIIVASCSRTATLGLYQAFKILGYRPYHLYELSMIGGETHWQIMIQGMNAVHNRFSSGHLQPRYTKKEFDKWLTGYDTIVEIPSYFDMEFLEAYVSDPEVKFVLTERTPESWARSFNTFIGGIVKGIETPPLNILRHFNRDLNYFCVMNLDAYNLWADHTRPGEPENEAALMRNYERYIRDVKRTVPAERMLVVKLEDGLGWEQICPFLGKEVPKGVAYPRGVEQEELKNEWLKPRLIEATVKLVLTVALVTAAGVGLWKWIKAR